VFSKYSFFHWLYSPLWSLASDFQFYDHFTDGRTPWASDQLVARPLPKHRTTQTQNKHIHIPNIHALCGIRTHDLGFRASEDSTCLRPLSYVTGPSIIRMMKLRRMRWAGHVTRMGEKKHAYTIWVGNPEQKYN
jgi:hypothetical protein